jgi:hypothetical protein
VYIWGRCAPILVVISLVISHPGILLGILAPLAALVAVEVYLRVRYRTLLWVRIYPQVYVPDEDLAYRYIPNSEGEIRIAGIHRRFKTNNQGFHASDFQLEKPPGTYRIAVVGASNTTGIWMNGESKNYCQMLEDMLRASGRPVEVMNFGIDGRYRAVHEMRLIEKDIALYRPDLVLVDLDIPFVYGFFRRAIYAGYVMIYNPETELSRKWCEVQIDHIRRYRFLPVFYYASYIVRAAVRYYMNHRQNMRSLWLTAFVENRIQAPDVTLLPLSLKRSVEALQATRDKLAAQGCDLVIFQHAPNLYYRQVTMKYELSYIELDVPPIPEYVHDLDGHYRYEGHVQVARQLFDQLMKRGAGAPTQPEQATVAAEVL